MLQNHFIRCVYFLMEVKGKYCTRIKGFADPDYLCNPCEDWWYSLLS